MTIGQVGQGAVAIVPTMRGFRRAVLGEVDGTTSASARAFRTGFAKAGTSAGSEAGTGFKRSFNQSVAGFEAAVAKASRDLSAARLKEQDATGKLRVAEAQLADARRRYASDSVQVVRAEERLASAQRTVDAVQDNVRLSTQRLTAAKRDLSAATMTAASSSTTFRGRIDSVTSFLRGGQSAARDYAVELRTGLGSIFPIFAGNFLATGASAGVAALGRLGAAAVRTGYDSIGLASDLGETRAAIGEVFGPEAAALIEQYASTANTRLGQTRTAALRGAQTFGVFGRAAGLTDARLSDFSTNLVTLSGDLASFYNADPSEVIEALGAGLRGEAEPLRRFGVLLDDATLRQRALELGIYKGNGSLTQQQRVLAAQAEILAQTGIAQGDFERTSGSLANQQRILQSSLEDTQVRLGGYLLPGFTSVVTYANTELLPRLGDVIDRVGPRLAEALETSGPKFEELLDKVDPLVDKLTDAAVDGLPGFIDGMNNIVDAAPEWIDAFESLMDPNTGPAGFLNGLETGLEDAGTAINDFFVGGGRDARTEWFDQFKRDLGFAGSGGANEFRNGLTEGTPMVAAAARSLAQESSDALRTYWRSGALETLLELDALTADFIGIGQHWGDGLAEGFRTRRETVREAAALLAGEAVRASAGVMAIKSPSRVAIEQGQYWGDGLAIGMMRRQSDVLAAAAELASIPTSQGFGDASGGAGSGLGGLPSTMVLRVGDRDFIGYVEELSDGRIAQRDQGSVLTIRNGKKG